MRCRHVEKLLSRYLDGACSEVEALELSRHLEHCFGCRAEYEKLASARDMAASLGTVPPPDDLWGSIRKGLASRPPDRTGRLLRPLRRVAVLTAATALFILA